MDEDDDETRVAMVSLVTFSLCNTGRRNTVCSLRDDALRLLPVLIVRAEDNSFRAYPSLTVLLQSSRHLQLPISQLVPISGDTLGVNTAHLTSPLLGNLVTADSRRDAVQPAYAVTVHTLCAPFSLTRSALHGLPSLLTPHWSLPAQ